MTTAAHYLAQHHALAGALPGRGLDWLQAHRDAALARFTEVGLPTQRDEDWRYTPTRALTAKNFRAVETAQDDAALAAQVTPLFIDGMQCSRLVFIDGLFAPKLSDAGARRGVHFAPLARVLEERPESVAREFATLIPRAPHGFTALNNAGARDGAVTLLDADAAPDAPLEMLFINRAEDAFAQPRNIIIAGANCNAQFIERHVSLGAHAAFTNSATEIFLGENARVDYYLVQTASNAARHVCGVWARQQRASHLRCITAALGGALVRNDLGVDLRGGEAHCDMLGLYAAGGMQHVDNHTTVSHAVENCGSRELYKGVLDKRARAVFRGRIVVARGAQQTRAEQESKTLLLSRHAEIDCKPQLEIYADDVRCSHGATVGQLDDAALFYLRSRGIDAARARELLTFAFAGDVLNEIKIDALQSALGKLIAARLAHH